MKNDTMDNRISLAQTKAKIQEDKLSMGSIKGKFPVILDDGKTTIYISDESKAEETKIKYELQRKSKFPTRH
jgi:hypothetical protein